MSRIRFCLRLLVAVFLAAIALPLSAAVKPGDGEVKPNIVFVEVDDLCYKYLGCFGNKVVKTPHIDALARQGVRFQNAMCQGMMCGPSRNSLIAGVYPHNLGFYANGQMGALPKGTWTLPAALQRSGYFTIWIGKSHLHPHVPKAADAPGKTRYEKGTIALRESMGFDHSFHSLGRAMLGRGREPGWDGYVDFLRANGLYEKFTQRYPKPTTLDEDREYMDGFFTTSALKWLDSYDGKKPFFLWVNYSCPHGPYDIPQKYLDLYRPQDMPPIIPQVIEGLPSGLIAGGRKKRTPERTMALRCGHAASVTYVDRQVGRIVRSLREKGILEKTVVVFFSDQGFMLGDHGLYGKGTLYKEAMNTALIMSYPRAFKTGVTITRPVELLDLVKTCLDLSNASKEDRERPYGYSLLPLLTARGEYRRRGPAFGEIEGFQAAVTERFKYIANAERPILFDLKTDPDELRNSIAEHPEVAERLRAAVDEWLRTTGPVLEAGALRGRR